MIGSSIWQSRWHAGRVIGRRDARRHLTGLGAYLTVALGMLVGVVLVRDHLDAVANDHVLVLADSFSVPFFAAALVAMLFLAISSTTAIAREKDAGTLEVLFYGPVDVPSYVLGKYAALLVAYLPMAVALAVLFGFEAAVTGLRLEGDFVVEVVLSTFAAAAVIAFGVCLSAATRNARAAFALLVVVFGSLLAVHVASDLLSGMTVDNNANPLLFLRDLMVTLDGILGYVSPFTTFQNGSNAAIRGDWLAVLGAVALLLVQAAVLLVAGVDLLRRKGVRR